MNNNKKPNKTTCIFNLAVIQKDKIRVEIHQIEQTRVPVPCPFNLKELNASYKKLWEKEIFPNIKNGLSAVIYTQTCDIEEEINGLMTYDRDVMKLDEELIRGMNEESYRVYREECR